MSHNAERKSTPLPPNATLGVFGGGQLGRMFAQAAARLGYRVAVFAPDDQPPAALVAARHVQAEYADLTAVERFASEVDAVTYEFENVPAATVEAAAARVPVRPSPAILAITRNRVCEKSFLQDHAIPVTPFARVTTSDELAAAVERLGGEAIVKTTELGYDGKGQCAVGAQDDPRAAWQALGRPAELIVEQRISLADECSLLIARDATGQTVVYGPFRNTHANHILDVTTWEAEDTQPWGPAAHAIGQQVADALQLEGLCCVECFVATNGQVMVNEIAPRPHNSGHLTIEACSISQFEQQARLTAGGPAIAPVARAPAAAMANLLGDGWSGGEPDWQRVWQDGAVTLHLYGKSEARPGRKMGHLTALAPTADKARQRVLAARKALWTSP